MEKTIKIVHYSEEFEKRHIEFASKFWTKKRRLTPEYIYWKFRGTDDGNLSFILAILEDKVIGQLGLVPCKLTISNETGINVK